MGTGRKLKSRGEEEKGVGKRDIGGNNQKTIHKFTNYDLIMYLCILALFQTEQQDVQGNIQFPEPDCPL